MAKLFFGMHQSLDGYVDHDGMSRGTAIFKHFTDEAHRLTGSLYGRRLYDFMRYWDNDDPDWTPEVRNFALGWRRQPKWVVSRTLKSVGPNATLIADNLEAEVRRLKSEMTGDIQVGGPELAQGLADLGLIDEFRIYLRPFVLGAGKPFFPKARPPLRLISNEVIGEDAILLTYVPT